MVVRTFRGILEDGGEDRIRLGTIKGKVGYRIVKFQVFPNKPGTTTVEAVVSIFNTAGKGSGTTTAVVDFTDNDLLAVAFHQDRHEATYIASESVVFDTEVFNQDIYVTLTDTVGSEKCNYYLELETMSLSEQAAEYTTVKDIRAQLKGIEST